MFKNITIRRKFIAAFVVLLAFAFLSAAWSIYSIYNIQQLNDANRRVLAINMLMENARKNEKAFLLSEVIDPSFYKNRRSTFQDSTIQVLQQAKENLDILMNSELADDTAFAESFGRINQYIINYNETFDALTTAALTRGWKDYGTVGHLREAIHRVENAAFPYDRSIMLMLRRHEKDFLLRKDEKYVDKFLSRIDTFRTSILKRGETLAAQDGNAYGTYLILREVDKYENGFMELVKIEKQIGLTPNDGLLGKLNQIAVEVEKEAAAVNEAVSALTQSRNKATTTTVILVLAVQAVLGIILAIVLSRQLHNLTANFSEIKNHLNSLSQGILPKFMQVNSDDEMGQTKKAINKLIDGLKRYAGFANNIGEGKLDTSFVKLSEEDSIGSSLLNMRDNLAQLSEEDRKRNWINEGVAKFSELLRSEDDREDFHFQLISHLVKYLEANQGSLYILNNDNQDQPYMQLEGAYAWGKRKYDDHVAKYGEGLIGQVWREKDVLFLTEVPDDYITITSGLGKANPTCLLIAPMVYNNEVMGIIEIASFRPLNKHEIELVERVSESIATTVSRLKTTNRTRYLYEQSQMQAEELRAQEEEMRQNNEELQAIQEEMRRKEQEYIDRIGELEKDNNDKGAEAKELQRKIEILEKMVMESEYTSEMISAKKKSGKKKASQE